MWFKAGYLFVALVVGNVLCYAGKTPKEPKKNNSQWFNDLPEELQNPWLTGPLLTTSPHTIPAGHINVQPYVYYNNQLGYYNNHWKLETNSRSSNINFQTYFQLGLTSFMDCNITPQLYANWNQGATYTGMGDLSAGISFQLLNDDQIVRGSPAVKLFIVETFPIGNYTNLNPIENGADATGDGSFSTKIGLAFGTQYHFKDYYWLRTRLALAYQFYTDVHVENFNTYGGGFGTVGVITRKGSFPAGLGLELTLSRHLAVALDLYSVLGGPNNFSGTAGFTQDGTLATVGTGSVYQFSMAPAIEWNFTPNVGLVGGVWFSVFGKNALDFVSGVISINLYR